MENSGFTSALAKFQSVVVEPIDSTTTVQYDEQQKQEEVPPHPVETILNYRFKDRKLLDEALTHSSVPGSSSSSGPFSSSPSSSSSSSPSSAANCSCSSSSSYQRLEFVGDAALGNAVANYLWIKYPTLDACDLSLLRSANVSTEKLARVAIRRRLHRFVRHKAIGLDQKIREFALAVTNEDEDTVIYGGAIKAPKVLADIVESIAAAVYIDCDFDLKYLWKIYRELLEPLVTLEMLQQQPEPVSTLFRLCQKQGKQLDFEHSRSQTNSTVRVRVDGEVVASSVSEAKATAKLTAARQALDKLAAAAGGRNMEPAAGMFCELGEFEVNDERNEIEEAKRVLYEICSKKKWLKPCYRLVSEEGPDHDRKFTCSVKVEVEEAILSIFGKARSRVRC